MIRLLIVAALLAGGPAQAQDLRYSNAATTACLAGQTTVEGMRACAGQSAGTCIAATPDGSTTVGMGYCLDQELTYWDARLNASYRTARARARATDTEMKEIGATGPSLEASLRDMQRAWIPFRDATCDFERNQWGGGTGGGPATLSCLMRLTAAQAIYLETAWIGD